MVEYSRSTSKPVYPPHKRIAMQVLAILMCLLPYAVLRVAGVMAVRNGAGRLVGLHWHLAAVGALMVGLLLCATVIPFWYARRLRSKLVAKVNAIYGEDSADAPMVGFSPGSSVRLYGGDTAKDIGLLVMKPGDMRYLGDTIAFHLSPQQIENVTLIQQSVLGMRLPRVLIGWRERPDTEIQGFTLEAWDASTLWQFRAAATALAERIHAWRNGTAV